MTGSRAFRGEHQAKPLKFDPAKLKGLSERLIRSHWENNYGGAVKALNAIERRLAMENVDWHEVNCRVEGALGARLA